MKLLSNKDKKELIRSRHYGRHYFNQPKFDPRGKKVKCPTQRKKLKLRNHSKVFDTSLVDIFKKVSSDEPCHVFFPRPPVTGFPKEGEVTEKTPGKNHNLKKLRISKKPQPLKEEVSGGTLK